MNEGIKNPVIKSKCETCMHYLGNQECSGFWDKIPDDIWQNKKEHDKIQPNQLLDVVYEEGKKLL